ncbi:MAG: hypothetical protein GX417_04060 [Clostridiales bacterium]|nr:hypothetical protein [Clostridiales bacterium]
MRNTKKIRLFAIVLALALTLTAIPLYSALADDAGHIVLFSDVTDDTEKSYLQTVSGAPGDKITVYIPILNQNLENATDISCSLPVSADTSVFPFSAGETDTELTASRLKKWDAENEELISWDGNLAVGERAYFKMDATLLSSLTPGNYYLPFVITYSDGSNTLTDTVSVYIYVREKTAASSGSSGGSSYKSKPKVILEAYNFSEDAIYAGDTVALRLVVANTSTREAITNLQLDFSNDAGVILPAPGGSNSVFIGTIDKGDAYVLTVNLQIAPDAEAKSQLLNVKFSYEGTKNRQDFEETASVSVPVLQKTRVRINDPVIYDDPWIGSTVSIGVTLYNLGKSTLYNCMVDIVGEGLTLEETYFGGNISSGGTMRADLSVTPNVGGELDAKVRVTYEDVNGNPTEELLPLNMFVNQDAPMSVASPGNGGMELPGDKPASANIGWIFWALGGVAVVAGLVVLGIRVKKNRERALEDL